MSSAAPPPSSSGPPTVDLPDPVAEIIVGAGHRVGPRVLECAQLAAAAHAERHASRRADGPAVNRSTFIWALGRVDVEVRSALDVSGVDIDEWGRELGIAGDGRPTGEPYALAVELDRAIRAFVTRPSKMQLTVTTWALAVAVFEDVTRHGGLAADRLRQFGTSAEAVLADLRMPSPDDVGAGDLPLVREVEPRRFGVQVAEGVSPAPYVPRDIDPELDQRLREREPVVAVEAPVGSGAIRTVYEALRRERPEDRVLLLHEWLADRMGDQQPGVDELERLMSSGADVVWLRNLGELLDLHPVLDTWFRARGDAVAATLVLVVRPEDTKRAESLGLLPVPPLGLRRELSPEEQARADRLYDGDVLQVSAIASATLRRAGATRATYAADSAIAALLDEAHDDLDILGDVDMLARLIASKDVHPPLSIGLFGHWGSGKSFIMKQVQARIQELAKQSRELNERNAERRANGESEGIEETGYLAEVVPVEFNAWQYAHGEALWAALINRVFEQLREHLENDDRYRAVLQHVADKDTAVAQARAKVQEAQSVVDAAKPAGDDRVIADVAQEHDMPPTATDKIEAGLQIDVAKQQVSDLRDEYHRLLTARSRLGRGWTTATRARRALVVGLAVVGVAAVLLYVFVPDAFAQLLALVSGVLSLVTALTQVLKPVNEGLEQVAEVLRVDDADKQRLQQAQDDLARATRELVEAKASGLAGLYGYVSERSSAQEYRQLLGMAPMIRDDLERLASRSREGEGLPGIERIVIFIDDLDRCPASEVVRVLEAVNLLFGFELFVVVVAVDSRWLIRSLDGQFGDAFDKDDPEAPTAQNYLEKIIQIPFWVQPMRPDGFGRLVTSLAGQVDVRRASGDGGGGRGTAGHGPAGDGGTSRTGPAAGPTNGDGGQRRGSGGDISGEVPGRHTGDGGEVTGGDRDVVTQTEDGTPQADLNPAALRLTSDERDLMTNFLPLVQTPRAVKRLLNTYQLLRVSVDDVDAFLDRKEYAPVLVLLALMTGTVQLSDGKVDELAGMREGTFAEFLTPASDAGGKAYAAARRGWEDVAAACAGLPTETLTPEILRTWMPKVARYSFHHVQVEASSQPPQEPSP
ncbi:KAP family P-loop NTPase fold protein [Knoellia sp. CPCC 206450]|uniref:KAP family P-loop NTPase fold protein n=1 Tax=Knoellia tibetensis TaxID=3404798 RepID=UPI003B42FE25